MKKTNKKGFTIVELVIVIAVVAILAAVLIPTFSSLIKKANESADIQLARNLNNTLAYSTVEGYPATYQDVYNIMKSEGYDLSLVVTRSGATLAWDKTSNSIVLISKEGAFLYNDPKTYATLEVPVYNDEAVPAVNASGFKYVAMTTIDNASADFGGAALDLNNNYLSVKPVNVGTVSNGFVKKDLGVQTGSGVNEIKVETTLTSAVTFDANANYATTGENGKIVVDGAVFAAAAYKTLTVSNVTEDQTIVFENCIFDGVALVFSAGRGNIVIENCIFRNIEESYSLNFSVDGFESVTIKDCQVIDCQRGFLLRTPCKGEDLIVDGCTFNLSGNDGGSKARAIQIATFSYYYYKQTGDVAIEYYEACCEGFGASYNQVNGTISITNNNFAKAAYGVYIYEAEAGGGFTYGGSANTLFADLSGNTFGNECTFKYGCGNIGDGRSYTDKGYNTGYNYTNAAAAAKREAISDFNAEDYWDQMRAINELANGLK